MGLNKNSRTGRLGSSIQTAYSDQNRNSTGRSAMFSAFRQPTFFMKAVQWSVAAAMVLSQPVYARQIVADAKLAGPVLTADNPTVIPGFAGFTLTPPPEVQHNSATAPALTPIDAYALLNDFVITTDQGGGAEDQDSTTLQGAPSSRPHQVSAAQNATAPNDAIHMSLGTLRKNSDQSSQDAYSILSGYLKAAEKAAARDAAQALTQDQTPRAPGPSVLGTRAEVPQDQTHAAFLKGPAKDTIVSDAEPALTVPHGTNQPILLAANEPKAKAAKKLDKDNGGATYVGSQACVKCHKSQSAAFAETLHGKIFLKQPRNANERLGCEGCHGPASTHIQTKEGDNGGAADIIGFNKESPRAVEDRNAVCLNCHEKADRTYWNGSTHETRGLACTNCHQLMEKVSVKNQLVKSTELETCFQCHKDRRAQLVKSNHMPLENGTMTCSSCHNPHGSATDKLLKEASVNETCYKCHAEKRGPYLWEHEPVRDNCLNCHDPHGTINQYMLKMQRNRLCATCHVGAGHFDSLTKGVKSFNRSCQNCHTMVHGSNAPAGSLFQR